MTRPRFMGAFGLEQTLAHVDAVVLLGIVNALFWAMITYETSTYGEGRYRLRHGLLDD